MGCVGCMAVPSKSLAMRWKQGALKGTYREIRSDAPRSPPVDPLSWLAVAAPPGCLCEDAMVVDACVGCADLAGQ